LSTTFVIYLPISIPLVNQRNTIVPKLVKKTHLYQKECN